MAIPIQFDTVKQTLSNQNFRNYMFGNFASQLAIWVQRVAVQWLTWELTHDPKWLGIIAFVDFFPNVVLAPIAGAVADRVNRLSALRLYMSISAAISASIAVCTILGLINITILAVLVCANGMVLAFNFPVRLAIVHSLVERERLASAIGIGAMAFNVARITGPAIAGIMIWLWGVAAAMCFTVVADLIFVGALYAVRLIAPKAKHRPNSVGGMPGEIMAGFRYTANHAAIAPLFVILVSTYILARPFVDLLAGFADDVFGLGASGLAWLTAMVGVGALAGSTALASQSNLVGLTKRMIRMLLLLILSVIGFTATDNFTFALICATVSGYCIVTVGVTEQTLLQAATDDAMRGRVMSFYTLVARGCPAIGALLMGSLAAYFGLRPPVALGAVCCLGVWYWAYRRQDQLAAALEK